MGKKLKARAFFVGGEDQGYLKVSFFGPFFGSYVVFELDHDNYEYAFISGPDRSYLWLLSRTPEVDDETIRRFEEQARSLGFKLDELVLVSHEAP